MGVGVWGAKQHPHSKKQAGSKTCRATPPTIWSISDNQKANNKTVTTQEEQSNKTFSLISLLIESMSSFPGKHEGINHMDLWDACTEPSGSGLIYWKGRLFLKLVKQKTVTVFQQSQRECFRNTLNPSHASTIKIEKRKKRLQKTFTRTWENVEGKLDELSITFKQNCQICHSWFCRTLVEEATPASLSRAAPPSLQC